MRPEDAEQFTEEQLIKKANSSINAAMLDLAKDPDYIMDAASQRLADLVGIKSSPTSMLLREQVNSIREQIKLKRDLIPLQMVGALMGNNSNNFNPF